MFQKDLGAYQHSVDAANESGEHLVSKVLDDPAVTKEDLRQLNEGWDDLCQQSVDKQDRLDQAHKAAVEFEQGFTDLVTWVGQQMEELQAQAEPADDPTALQQQIEDNKVGVVCVCLSRCLFVCLGVCLFVLVSVCLSCSN